MNFTDDDGHMKFEIRDSDGRTFTVLYNVSLKSATFSCKHFEMYGWLCRHVFVVLKDVNAEVIPSAHILSRWTKTAILNPMFCVVDSITDQCARIDDRKIMVNKLWSDIHLCVGLVETSMDRLVEFSKIIENHKHKLTTEQEVGPIGTKNHRFEMFVGTSVPQELNIHPPTKTNNKGSRKRIKSMKEQAIEKSVKKRRICKTCGERSGHNTRTCHKRHEWYVT
ncbi:Protein FAR1-RELATED SEQUENCE 1 [Striga hermonthica]|uniref:Protein FAR1-RELATED SEQUENCE 1 n=1 Tax=Striga hermonthica TaxID=68872 RepID=A0A9N7P1P6_STRHE|nr:Protein FAR1-RELATED SEQUENCE 1 [Striga hermonthica]